MIKKITIYILAGLVFMLPLIVTASEIPAHEIVYEEKEEGSKIYKIEEGGLTLIAIAGIKDIIRDEVPDAVA